MCQIRSECIRVGVPQVLLIAEVQETGWIQDRAADLTRGGGPYACLRIGLASGLPA